MQYSDGIEDSRRYLRLTLELIGKHGLPTDPLNYCIWYEYVSGNNEELKAAIDNHLEKGRDVLHRDQPAILQPVYCLGPGKANLAGSQRAEQGLCRNHRYDGYRRPVLFPVGQQHGSHQ